MEWSTYWSAVSAIATFVAAFIAVWAMFRWRKQEELKAKLNFKLAIANYTFQLTQMPKKLDQPNIRLDQVDNCEKLTHLLSACNNAWVICEGLLDKNRSVCDAWYFIFDSNKLYFSGDIEKSALGEKCVIILNEKFVFD